MLAIVLLVLAYCFATVTSIVLLGDKQLISGNLYRLQTVVLLVLNWKFIVSMMFAVLSRLTFILLNNAILKMPHLANASTTITTFCTLVSFIFIVFANYYFLNERLNFQQCIGALIILIGVGIIFK